MKKIGILAIACFILPSSIFAAELTMKGAFTEILKVSGSPASTNAYSLGKGRLDFKLKINDQSSFTVESKIEGADGFAIDYAFLDVTAFDGKLRFGTQTDGIANMSGGYYRTSTFQNLARNKTLGVGYYTTIEGVNLSVVNLNGAIDKDVQKVYVAKADTKFEDWTVSVMAKYGAKNDATGIALEGEATYKLGHLKLSGQYYTDLSDGAAVAFMGKTKAQAYLGLYGVYDLGIGTVYTDYVTAANDDTKNTTWKNEYEWLVGASYSLNPDVKLYAELAYLKPINSDIKSSSTVAVEVKF